MTIKPLGNRIIVKELPQRALNSPIVLPQNLREEFGPKVCRVLQVGPKVKEVLVGQRVLAYSYHDGAVVVPDDSGRKIITEDQVLLVIPPNDQASAPSNCCAAGRWQRRKNPEKRSAREQVIHDTCRCIGL